MPRKPIIRSNDHYYHLVARSNNKDFFDLPLLAVWEIMTSKLGCLQKEFKLQISAFVLMDNHFHLLMLTPDEDIDRVMYFFMKNTTLAIQKYTARINKIFGGRYKGCIIENQNYLLAAYKYIYQNPIRAKLAGRAQDYIFSTLNPETRKTVPFIIEEIIPLALQSGNRELESRWINETFTLEETKSIRTGLSKSQFSFQRNRSSKQEICPRFYF